MIRNAIGLHVDFLKRLISLYQEVLQGIIIETNWQGKNSTPFHAYCRNEWQDFERSTQFGVILTLRLSLSHYCNLKTTV